MEEKDKNLVQETSENATLTEQMEEEREFLSDKAKIMSPGRLVAKRFFRSKLSVIGLVILIALYVLSFVGPWFTGYHYSEIDQNPGNIKYTMEYVEDGDYWQILEDIPTQNLNDPPSSRHWLGTDGKGRDVLTRTFWGGRISMTLGFVVILLEGLIGIVLGGIAGYFGKWVDQLIMRIVDIFMCVPTFPIMLIAGTLLDAYEINGMSRIYWLMLVLTIFGWAGISPFVGGFPYRLGGYCPFGARSDTHVERAGVHDCGGGDGTVYVKKDIQAPDSQRHAAAYCFHDDGTGRNYHFGSHAQLSGTRRSGALRFLGNNDKRHQGYGKRGLSDCISMDSARNLYHTRCAGLQLCRRRLARRF